MKNVPKKVAPVWIAARTKSAAKQIAWQKWTAVKTANAPKRDITGKTAANKKNININFKET